MKESLAPEHEAELIGYTLEAFLNRSRVSNECYAHLQATRRNVTVCGLYVVGDPFDEEAGVLRLNALHLVLNFLHRHLSTEIRGNGEVASMTGITSSHHVLRVEHLGCQFGHRHSTILLTAARGQRSETDHEEVQAREGNHVDGQFTEVRVQLTRESQAGGDTRHDDGDKMVQVTILGCVELQCAEADVVESFVVDTECLIGVLDKLVDRQCSIVRFHDCVGHLGRWHDREGCHHTVRVFFADFRDQKRSHPGTGTTTKGVRDLESLKHVTVFGLLTDDVQDGVDKLSTFGVVTFGPVVSGTRLPKHKVVGAENSSHGSRTDGVHCTRLQVDEYGARYVLLASRFVAVEPCEYEYRRRKKINVLVDIDALQLQVCGTLVGTGGINSMLIGKDLPELGT